MRERKTPLGCTDGETLIYVLAVSIAIAPICETDESPCLSRSTNQVNRFIIHNYNTIG